MLRLAESLDMQPPVMPDDGNITRITTGTDVAPSSAKEPSVLEPIWDDEDTKAFYESLPDLRAFVPAVLLGEAEPKLNEQHAKGREQSELITEQDTEVHDIAQTSSVTEYQLEGKANDGVKDSEEKDKNRGKDADKEKSKEKDLDRKTEREKEKIIAVDGASLDNLLQRLPGCVSRDLVDQLTVEFCYLNSKASRKKLVQAIFNVPRTSLELLPYYSRLVATLSTCMKDVPSMLLAMLEEEFNFLINKKDQINIETKIKNIRFIGELCKFKCAPSALVFSCLKACLDDFSHHNIDVACNLLETCGRFLYRSPETTIRMANMLEILMRLKNVKNLDPRHSTLVKNAYYLCKPPERSAQISKVRPPLHQYIRKLLFSDLDKSSVEHVLRQLRKLPWVDCQQYLLKCFLKVHKGKYSHVHLIALLTAGLSRHHDDFAIAVVDEVLEEMRVGLELNDYGMQQRRLAHMRFLGEDLFAELRPNMARYSSVEELDAALVELEESERAASVDKPENERHSDSESQKMQPRDAAFSVNGRGSANGAEENGKDHEGADSESYSDSGSIDGHEDEEDLMFEEKSNDASENEGDDEDDGMPAGSDEDEGVEVRHKVVKVDPKEQEDFDRELKALLQESLESRKSEVQPKATLNMMVPMNVLEGSKDPRAVESESGEETVDEEGGSAGGGSKVRVKVLMKKGHKQQTKQMLIPGDCSLVQSTKQ